MLRVGYARVCRLLCRIVPLPPRIPFFFFFNDTATTEIYTLSLHDALPISCRRELTLVTPLNFRIAVMGQVCHCFLLRSEEHTSELQSRLHLVCRLLLEKKKKTPAQALPKPA